MKISRHGGGKVKTQEPSKRKKEPLTEWRKRRGPRGISGYENIYIILDEALGWGYLHYGGGGLQIMTREGLTC